MKLLRNLLIMNAVFIGVGYLSYKFVLSNEAQEGIKNAARTIYDSAKQLNDVVEDITGIVIEEDDIDLPNRNATIGQWAKLGY